jgi:hypothetical protein
MLSSFILSLIFAATLPIASKASVPTVFRQRDLDGGLVSRRPQLEALQLLQERDTITLGTFNLSYTAPPSDVLMYDALSLWRVLSSNPLQALYLHLPQSILPPMPILEMPLP